MELDIALWRRGDVEDAIAVTEAVLERIYQLSDSHPKKYNLFLDAEDGLIYLESERELRDLRR